MEQDAFFSLELMGAFSEFLTHIPICDFRRALKMDSVIFFRILMEG